jgi:hypothetical protein
VKKMVGIIGLGIAAAIAFAGLPSLRRYLKIEKM